MHSHYVIIQKPNGVKIISCVHSLTTTDYFHYGHRKYVQERRTITPEYRLQMLGWDSNNAFGP